MINNYFFVSSILSLVRCIILCLVTHLTYQSYILTAFLRIIVVTALYHDFSLCNGSYLRTPVNTHYNFALLLLF